CVSIAADRQQFFPGRQRRIHMRKFSIGLLVPLFALALAGAGSGAARETTPAMVAAAVKEGKVVWYTSVDVKVAEVIAKAFRAEYPGIEIDVERSGSERVFQRINQEYQSGIKNVDVVNSSDASHFIFWKQQKWLAAHRPPDRKPFASHIQDCEATLTGVA